MKINHRIYRNIKKSNQAAAGIVVAVLMLGLFFTMYALVQGVYVPQWMETKEAEHMDQVANQFAELKSSVDMLTVMQQPYSSVTNPITLGSREMPFLASNRAYGNLAILPTECEIIIEDNVTSVSYTLGSIKYSSQNAYYLDQSYIYENGAVILSQSKDDLIIIKPNFLVTNDNDFIFNLIKISDIGGISTASGYKTYPLQTRYSGGEQINIHYVRNLTVISPYKDAWEKFFTNILSTDDFDYIVEDTTDGDGIVVRFSEYTDYPIIDIKLHEIEAQISPGWTE